MRKPELLIPASSLEVLKTAVMFGADAVYIGGEAFWGFGRKQRIFQWEDMKEGIAFCPCAWSQGICDGEYSGRIMRIWAGVEHILWN